MQISDADVIAARLGGNFPTICNSLAFIELKMEDSPRNIELIQGQLVALQAVVMNIMNAATDAEEAKKEADEAVQKHEYKSKTKKNKLVNDPSTPAQISWNSAVQAARDANQRVDDLDKFTECGLSARVAAIQAALQKQAQEEKLCAVLAAAM